MTLVEVIIYSSLTALTLTVIGGLFATGLQTQAAARDRDTATGAAQVVSNSLQTGLGNASDVFVSGTLIKARVATGATGWQCAAWALTADGKVVYKAASTAITSTDYSTWPVVATGAKGALAGGAAFGGDSARIDFSLRFDSGSITVPVAGAIVPDAFGTGSPSSCW